jgi:spore coat polysaccharide biosynthesis protein SpsF
MKIVAIVQARMGSSRLPQKVLKDLGGATVLDRVLRRLGRARLMDQILVATTQDSVIVDHCGGAGPAYFEARSRMCSIATTGPPNTSKRA